MKITNLRKLFVLVILAGFLPLLNAEDKRTIPLDVYLIIDGSTALENSKNEVIAWLNSQMVDRILLNVDKITVWTAGDKAQVIYSDTLSEAVGKNGLKDKLQALDVKGKTADFPGALKDMVSRMPQTSSVSKTTPDRLSYTMLITASAEGLEPTLTRSAQGLLRWFRSEKYSRWQVLIVAPDINKKVQQYAAAYMSSIR